MTLQLRNKGGTTAKQAEKCSSKCFIETTAGALSDCAAHSWASLKDEEKCSATPSLNRITLTLGERGDDFHSRNFRSVAVFETSWQV